MTNAHDTTGNEATMWTDEAMHAAYKEAFDKDPDAHHWALLSWIRDDMQQALAAGAAEHAAALARIAKQDNLLTAYRQACEKWEEIFQEQEAKTSELATTIGERDKLIGHLSRQLAERSEWTPLTETWEHQSRAGIVSRTTVYNPNNNGISITAIWDSGRQDYAGENLPADIRLCRKQSEDAQGKDTP